MAMMEMASACVSCHRQIQSIEASIQKLYSTEQFLSSISYHPFQIEFKYGHHFREVIGFFTIRLSYLRNQSIGCIVYILWHVY